MVRGSSTRFVRQPVFACEIPSGANYYATVLGRGRFDGTALQDIEDVFVADAWSTAPGGHGARILFAPDGTIFMTQPHRRELDRAQDTMDHVGTILRLNDDGTVPADNPFVGRSGYRPEIYPTATGSVKASRFTRKPDSSGRPNMDRRAATKPTSSFREGTTVGRLPRSVATMTGRKSRKLPGSMEWYSLNWSGCPRLLRQV